MRHSRALVTITAATALDVGCGLVFAAVEHLSVGTGLYWAVSTATTVGYGDVVPHTSAGRVVSVVAMMTVIPLFAATFSLVTSGITTEHVKSEGQSMRARIEHLIYHHPDIPPFEDDAH